MQFFRRLYCRIPAYGQLIVRRDNVKRGWVKSTEVDTYYSLMLKGSRRNWFSSNTFYLVFTEHCLEEAIKRGELNERFCEDPIPFGLYTGIRHIDRGGHLKNNTCDGIFLRVFRYERGGTISEHTIVMSERQFRRAIIRAKTRPELLSKRRFWHGFYSRLYKSIARYSES